MIGWDGNISGDKRWLTDGAMLLKSRGVAVTIGKRMRARSHDHRRISTESIERCFTDATKKARGWKPVELPRPRKFAETHGGLFSTKLHANGIPFDANRIEVIYRALGKGGRLRPAFLTGQAVAALHRYLSCGRGLLDGNPRERHLFLSQRGTAISNQGAWQAIAKRARVLGRHVHPHMLRHTFAVVMLKGGTDLRTLQLLLGHAKPETTAAYLRLDDEWLREAHHAHHPRGRG